MDTPPAMDKKPLPRLPQLPVKSGPEGTVKDYGGKKYVGQCARKREGDRPDPGRKPMGGRGGRAGQRYVRPREKMGGKVELGVAHPESGSLYCAGGKKQNIAHLLDWWGPGHRSQSGGGGRVARVRRHSSHVPKYSKEHYLQANCQFVVDDCEDYSIYSANQDLLVEWNYVEEVRLHVSVAPSCPICLHAPTAAKVTRCGHIYCFPCVLHYLALSDKKWRKCPICYEPVTKDDLKSVVAICHKEFDIGEEVELQLMRRERESFLPVPAPAFSQEVIGQTPRLSCPTAATPYAKLLVASREEVKSLIVAREQNELELQLEEEGDQPEACFLQEALALLQARRDSLNADTPLANPTSSPEEGMEMLSLSSPEEPSSSGSQTSFEEVPSPLSPATLAGEESAVLDELQSQGQEEQQPESTVTVQDLDISQLQPLNGINPGGHVQRNVPKPTFYFYQARNGAHIYLHALNVQMLVHEYGALENCPHTLTAKVVEKETAAMTEELRMRLRYLRHLPVTCNFDVVEVALRAPIVSKATIALFQDQIDARKRKRNKRAREERKIEKRVQAEEDRMMGRSKGPTNIKIESLKQFPSFSEDFPARTNNEVNEAGVDGCEGAGNDLGSSPNSEALGSLAPNTIATGMSFAKMTREGQAKVPHPCTEPVDIGIGTWPSLGGSASRNDRPSQRCGVSTAGRGWEGRDRVSESSCGNCAEDEEDMAAPPEYRHAFSNAMAKALDAVTAIKKSADDDIVKDGCKRGRTKKKQKKVLLFSSGGLN